MSKSPNDLSEMEIRRICGPLLREAEAEAARLKHNYIGTEHIFNGLTRIPNGIASRMIIESGLEVRDVRNAIRREVGMGDDIVSEVLAFTPRAYGILVETIGMADDMGMAEVTEDYLLLNLLVEGEGVPVRKLIELGVDIDYWIEYLTDQLDLREGFKSERNYFSPDLGFYNDDDMDEVSLLTDPQQQAYQGGIPTPLLDKFGRDLTEQAKMGKLYEAIGREMEIRAVARTLTRSKKNNPLLVGDAGVGKTAVVEGLAWQIANGKAPVSLKDRRIVQIEIGMLVAGTSLRGQFEERLVGIVEEAKQANNIILFIDEIHTIVGAGDTIDSNLDAANILKPALARGEIACIGATTYEEYRKAVARDPALDRRFRTIDIEEPSVEDTLTILERVYPRYEEHHSVKIAPSARKAAVSLAVAYLTDRRLPDKALDLLDEACARVVIESTSPDEENPIADPKFVTEVTVTDVVSEWTGIPVSDLTSDERGRLTRMYERLTGQVMGQTEAVRSVADTILTHRAGMANPRRPIGVFLFVGPSGVGKTALAQALTEYMFGDPDSMIRLDMSEFYDEHTAARLIGAPPGYKGMERGGQLTEAIRRRPYSVVLMDEVEKAAPEVFDLFLQVFDEGRLSDAKGGTVDCRHAVWIMTSNVGIDAIGKNYGFMAHADDLPDYSEHLKKFFRPEFLNRLDEIVVFKPLDRATLNGILDQYLDDVNERLDKKDLKITVSQEVRQLLLEEGSSVTEGARPLRRAVERLLMRPLSLAILENKFANGESIQAMLQDEAITFRKKRGAAKTPPNETV
jgi:ATP-dependent Clp protease ATP-binding subunit ClpC